MNKLTIELVSSRALPLLQELENLNIIRMVRPQKEEMIDKSGIINELFELQGAMRLSKKRYDEYKAFTARH